MKRSVRDLRTSAGCYRMRMTRVLVIGALVVLLAVGALLMWKRSAQTPRFTETSVSGSVQAPVATSSSEMHLAVVLYPLYSRASWSRIVAETVTMGTTTYSGAYATSTAIDAGMNPGAVLTPFTDYYDRLLKSRGWRVANDLAAGGHVGGQTGYRNGPDTILVGYRIDYSIVPKNAPSQCPCTVSLSLFSSGTGGR